MPELPLPTQSPAELKARARALDSVRTNLAAMVQYSDDAIIGDITEQKKTEVAMRRLNRELRAISICNQTVLRAQDEQALLNEICRIVCEEAGYRMAWVAYAEPDEARTLRPVASAGFESDYIAEAKLSWSGDTERGLGPAGVAVRSGKAVCFQDIASDPLMKPWCESAMQRGFRSGNALPLKDEAGKVFGVFMIYSSEPHAFTPEEIRLLEELAGDLAFGITVLRGRKERQRNDAINASRMHLISFAVNHSLDALLEETLNEAEKLTDSLIGFYHFVDDDQEQLSLQNWSARTKAVFCNAPGKGSHYPINKAGVWVECVSRQTPVIHNDYASLPNRKGLPEGHAVVIRELVAPVLRSGKIKAILGVGNKPTNYDEKDVAAISLIADLAWEIAERKQAEEVMRINERRYRLAQAMGHVGNWEYNLQTRQFWGSDEAKRIYGFDRGQADFTADEVENCIPDRERVHQALVDLIEENKPYGLEFDIIPRNSSGRRTIISIAELHRDEQGNALNVAGVIQDITERKAMEEESRFKNALLTTQQEVSLDGILIVDEKDRIISSNKRFATMWSIPGNLMASGVDRPVLEHVCKMVTDRNAFLEKVTYLYNSRKETSEDELNLKDGRTFSRYSAPMAGADGKYYGRVWFFRDITERKRTEAERLRLSTAIEQVAESIVITDTHGTIQFVNPAFELITGYSRQEATGKNPRILNSGVQDTAFFKKMWSTLKSGSVWSGCIINKRKDGTHYEEEATISPIRGPDGEVTNYVAVKRDISERRKFESQLLRAQRMESLGTLACGIAHDLNNVLQPVLMVAPLLAGKVVDQDVRHLISMVESSAQRGADIIKQLLVFGRGAEVAKAPLNLTSLIKEMVKIAREVFPKDVAVFVDLPKDLGLIHGNPTHLHQVLMNLAVNARDAMPHGGTLAFRASNVVLDETYAGTSLDARPGAYVMLEVSDTGTGIRPDILDRIFDPFFTTKETGKGTGLGLSTVLGIVRDHGGFLEVTSQAGNGSKFKIYIPALKDDAISCEAAPSNDSMRGQGELVLVVDDEPAVRNVLQQTLEQHGYRVLVANDGVEALAMYVRQNGQVNAVVTDIAMPGMNGMDLARALKRLDPTAKVIASTGQLEQNYETALKELGVGILLKKPYKAESVLRALECTLK